MRLLAKEETPLDWTSRKIGSYVLGHKGGAALCPTDFSDTGFPVIPKKAIQSTGELLIKKPTYCTNEFASNNERSIVDNSYTITTLRDLVPTGPTIGTVVNFTGEEKYILSQGVYGLKLNDHLDKRYLSYLSNTAFYRKVMQRMMVGSTQVHIRTPEYLDLEIQLPPLPEQQKIAKILSTWDKAISTTERLIDNSTQQKKALMQQLLTGKQRLLDDAGERFAGDWEEVILSNIAKVFIGLVTTMTKYYVDAGTPLIRNSDIKPNFITKQKMLKLCDSFANEHENRKLRKNDIVTVHTGEVGVSAVIDEELDGCIGFATLNTRPVPEKINSQYLSWYFNSSIFINWCVSMSTGDGRQNLNLKDFVKAKIMLPCLVEQQKIATVLTNADQEINLLEQQLADLQQEKKALMQVLLTGKKRVVVEDVIEK